MTQSNQSVQLTLSQIFITYILGVSIVYAQDEASPMEDDTAQTTETTETTEPPRTSPDTHKAHLTLLTTEVDGSDLQWIEAPSGKFMGLWRQDQSSTPYGAILILHGEGQNTESPHSVRALRKNLSLHGWSTLAISLPTPDKPLPPPRPVERQVDADASENTVDSANSQAAPSTEQNDTEKAESISNARIDAAVDFLKTNGQYNIVIIGHGVGAVRGAKYIDQLIQAGDQGNQMANNGKIQRPIRAFVLVEARNVINHTEDQLMNYFNDKGMPILDVYFNDHYMDKMDADTRRVASREKHIESYYQVKVLRPNDSTETWENRLTRRVRGFLNKHAKGVEIGKRN